MKTQQQGANDVDGDNMPIVWPVVDFGTATEQAATRSLKERRTAFVFKRHDAAYGVDYYEVHTDTMLGRARGGEVVAFVSSSLHRVR